ncbi:UDP-glucuronosyl/UDP-glucosyltransferase [Corchorus olitorius]|uniref:UDP-glucuronosyl/UDP-glucosyltransferase n=1 Tax=Corchorus olitorius TaxID=93759 RepID=A0A1R3I1D3_9ROSI|nr:UDP-glucuronosyl/UDP-glucosyltransferase [Corchorus olitorius]
MEEQKKSHREQKKNLRLLLFPLPFQGHLSPMLQLGNILYSKGFSITIIHTCFNSPNPSNNPHFTFHSIPDGLSQSTCRADNIVTLVSLLNANCVAPFRDCLANMLSADVSDHEEPIACLISDAAWNFTGEIAEKMKLPRLLLRTNNVSSFLAVGSLPLLQEKGYLPLQESRLEEPVIELPPLKFMDIPVFKTQDQESILQSIAELVKQTKSCSGVIWNTIEEMEREPLTAFRVEFPVPIFPIGPLHKYFHTPSSSLMSQDQTSILWLDKQKPKSVIYVSFGSVASIEESELLEIAWGLADSKQPFLWVVRPGSVCGSEWLESLPNELDRLEIAKAVRKLLVEVEGQEIRERIVHLQKLANQCIQKGEDQDVPSDVNNIIALLEILNLNCLTPFRDCLSELLSSSNEDPIACLVTDALWHFTQAVANGLKIPRIVLRTSNASAFLAFNSKFVQDSQAENKLLDGISDLKKFFSISDGLPEDQVVPSDADDLLALFKTLNLNCLTPFRDCLSELLSSNDEDPIICLVTDGLWYFTQVVANGLKIPRIVLGASNATTYLSFIPKPIPHERGDIVQVRADLCFSDSHQKIKSQIFLHENLKAQHME